MPKRQPEPEDGENLEDFIDRCTTELVDEGEDEDAATQICEDIWANRAARNGTALAYKAHTGRAKVTKDGIEFVLSDESVDRMGDIILQSGWVLDDFKNNPVALFGHDSRSPIGNWRNVRVVDKQLRGELDLLEPGKSPRIDEIRALIEAGVLKAVSVGFRSLERPIPRDPEKPWQGVTFVRQELMECSVVSVPANQNALAIAKSLNISPSTLDLVFAVQGNRTPATVVRGITGVQARIPPDREIRTMTPLAKRIEDAQAKLVALRDQLTEHLKAVDDDNVTDAQLATTQELNRKIKDQDTALNMLKESEASLAAGLQQRTDLAVVKPNGNVQPAARPFSLTPKKIAPIEYFVRSGVVAYFSHTRKEPIDQVRKLIYGDDEPTKFITDWTLKAATAPAMTSVAGWAAELVQQINADLLPHLMPNSVYGPLSAAGVALTFGRAGKINVPSRNATPTVAGSFVGEGQPIPVRQAAFSTVPMVPKKMAVITTWTREIDEHSVPAIEGLLRDAVQEDTSIAIDTVLLDTNAATLVRPAGLRNGVAGLTPTAGGGYAALVADLKALTGALVSATNGNVRRLIFLMNPQQALSIALTVAPGSGVMPFKDEIGNNQLLTFQVIKSGTVPLGTVIVIDAADFVSVSGDNPRFEVSDQATLHFEDTAPADIGTPGTPGVVAAPVKSLWQTDSLALRMILPINWAVRRAGVVAWVSGVTW